MSLFEELDAVHPQRSMFSSPRVEPPTPHKIAVLILIHQYLKAKQTTSKNGIMYPPKARQRFCMLLLKLIQYPDMSYDELHNLLTSTKYKIESVHLRGFEKSMSDLITAGIESLFDFVELQNIEKILSESIGLSQFSIVGLYIRRVSVILEGVLFPEMMALYKNIRLYYEKGVHILMMALVSPAEHTCNANCECNLKRQGHCSPATDERPIILDTATVYQDRNIHGKWSTKQADLFVTQQSSLLEYNELRALSPIELQKKLTEIVTDNPLHSQAYFLNYMNHLRIRDYFSTVDSLHRSFDRSPINMMENYEEKGFQYFSINLAILHASFNHRHEALEALRECIMLAQESGDKRCLDLANSWFCLLNSNKIDPFEKSLPDIQDPGLIQSLSLAIQFVVKFGAQCGYLPIDLFELLVKSDELNCKNSILEHYSDSLALRSALWCLYGRYEQSSLYAQLLLQLKKTWVFGDVGNSESVCKVLCNLALWLSLQGKTLLSAVVLNHARRRYPRYPNANNWMICQCYIKIQRAIYHCNWHKAVESCYLLYIIDETAGMLQHAAVFVAKRCLQSGRCLLGKLLQVKDLDCLTHVRALMLLALTMITPFNVAAEAINVLLKASTLALWSYLEYEYAIIDMMFAHILLQMGMKEKALQAIKNGMEKIFANGSIYDRARCDFIFVRCYVASSKDNAQKQEYLSASMEALERAKKIFKELKVFAKVLDIYAYIAQIYHEVGDVGQRNKYASKFRRHHKKYKTPREYLGMLM